MKQAVHAASHGLGNTYPNPAVGCVLVSSGEVIGVGFHPKAGYPHAEIFALFEACGLINSGMEAAKNVVEYTKHKIQSNDMMKIDELSAIYSSKDGAKQLFERKLSDRNVTAYVTLEPCCHYGKTPPCALSLVLAGVSRVVVGYRDPNPRVDGGGVSLLRKEGIQVDLMNRDDSLAESEEESRIAQSCADIVSAFVKRISPRTKNDGLGLDDYESSMNGAKRSLLRSIAGRRKMEGRLVEFSWPSSSSLRHAEIDSSGTDEAIATVELNHRWMEHIDAALWDKELILLRLGGAIQKKRDAKILGERIAHELKAHVAQVVGHTVLLYRPGRPPILDLNQVSTK
jgi:diaminohydroxyphosphoribosylaminopyrimidine deaminase/5-amino-6-(5-phosphoribosylamino)uracil reductase